MFEFDYNLIPLNQCIPLQMSDHLICLLWFFSLYALLLLQILEIFCFDLIDFNADTILERIFHLRFWCLAFGFWWSFLHCCYHLVIFFFFFDICDLVSLDLLFSEIFSFFFIFCFVTNWFSSLFSIWRYFLFSILNMIKLWSANWFQ